MNKIEREQLLPISVEEAWDFFTRPENLNAITPPDVHFQTLSELPDRIYSGLRISYRLTPLAGIPVRWITEIRDVVPHKFFVDEQLKGPYKLWHHEHHFAAVEGGTLMKDQVTYDVGKGIIGTIAHKLIVHKKLNEIFDYRYKVLAERFK